MRILVTAFLFLIAISGADAASFDCKKAKHNLEKTICADAELSKLDEKVAHEYLSHMNVAFDKNNFRNQQKDWQQLLRVECQDKCNAKMVKEEYKNQFQFLGAQLSETYSANYKTNDEAFLTIVHIDGKVFDFNIIRNRLDDGKTLCKLPASDDEPGAIAELNGLNKASWKSGTCKIDFTFKRDAKQSVVAIDLVASDGCKSYCTKPYGLSDQYIPENYWAAGNQ